MMKRGSFTVINIALAVICGLLVTGVLTGCGNEQISVMPNRLANTTAQGFNPVGQNNIIKNSFSTKQKSTSLYPVLEVVDGDTFKVRYNGKLEKVRLIGVNTPETHHPTKGVEPYGPEASAYTQKLLTGKSVRLEYDVQPRDKYGRLLAYAYLPDGTFINEVLVAEGYAQVMTIPPNVHFADRFVQLQRQAREAGKGLWGSNESSPTNTTTPIAQGKFVGSAKSTKYHRPDCQWAQKINSENLIWFMNGSDAQNKGYVPCKVCRPVD